jgi:hypothetical protein
LICTKSFACSCPLPSRVRIRAGRAGV